LTRNAIFGYNIGIVEIKERKMASAIIPAKDVGRVILEDLRKFASKEYPEATESERELLIAKFLNALSGAMFNGPVE